jgi:hypothetical protein
MRYGVFVLPHPARCLGSIKSYTLKQSLSRYRLRTYVCRCVKAKDRSFGRSWRVPI